MDNSLFEQARANPLANPNGYATDQYGGYNYTNGTTVNDLKKNGVKSAYGYLNDVANVQNKLNNDMSNESGMYMSGIDSANKDYLGAVNQVSNNYNTNTQGYVGNQGYQNALSQASKGAAQSANAAGAAAAGAARSAGMNKAQAAALGANQVINAYNQNLLNQQAQVQNNYNNAINTQGNIYNQLANASGNRYGQTTGAIANAYGTNANTLNSTANNMTNALGQNISNLMNQQTTNYNNDGLITKTFKDLGFGKL